MIYGAAGYMGYKIATGQFPGRTKPLTEAQALELLIALGVAAVLVGIPLLVAKFYYKDKKK